MRITIVHRTTTVISTQQFLGDFYIRPMGRLNFNKTVWAVQELLYPKVAAVCCVYKCGYFFASCQGETIPGISVEGKQNRQLSLRPHQGPPFQPFFWPLLSSKLSVGGLISG